MRTLVTYPARQPYPRFRPRFENVQVSVIPSRALGSMPAEGRALFHLNTSWRWQAWMTCAVVVF